MKHYFLDIFNYRLYKKTAVVLILCSIGLLLYGCPVPKRWYKVVSSDSTFKKTYKLIVKDIEFELSAFYGFRYNPAAVEGVASVIKMKIKNKSDMPLLSIDCDSIGAVSKFYDYRLLDISSPMYNERFEENNHLRIEVGPREKVQFFITYWRPLLKEVPHGVHVPQLEKDEEFKFSIRGILLGDKPIDKIEVVFIPPEQN